MGTGILLLFMVSVYLGVFSAAATQDAPLVLSVTAL